MNLQIVEKKKEPAQGRKVKDVKWLRFTAKPINEENVECLFIKMDIYEHQEWCLRFHPAVKYPTTESTEQIVYDAKPAKITHIRVKEE